MTLIEEIIKAINTDDCDQSQELIACYEKSTEAERDAIDRTFTYLCGWTLKTLIERNRKG